MSYLGKSYSPLVPVLEHVVDDKHKQVGLFVSHDPAVA